MRHRLVVWLIVVWALGTIAPARADQVRARKLFIEGNAAYAGGRFAEAAQKFEAAYAASPAANFLWNIAQAYRKQFEIDQDVANLRRARIVFQNFHDAAERDQDKKDARAAIEEVDQKIADLEAKTAPVAPPAPSPPAATPAAPAVTPVAPPPTAPGAVVPPGPSAPSGPAPPAVAAPPSALTPPVAEPAPRDRSLRPLGFGVAGAGAGLLVAGALLGAIAGSTSDSISKTGTPEMPVLYSQVRDDYQRGEKLETASVVLLSVGAAAIATGVVLVVLPRRAAAEGRPRAYIAPTSGGILVGGAF